MYRERHEAPAPHRAARASITGREVVLTILLACGLVIAAVGLIAIALGGIIALSIFPTTD